MIYHLIHFSIIPINTNNKINNICLFIFISFSFFNYILQMCLLYEICMTKNNNRGCLKLILLNNNVKINDTNIVKKKQNDEDLNTEKQ